MLNDGMRGCTSFYTFPNVQRGPIRTHYSNSRPIKLQQSKHFSRVVVSTNQIAALKCVMSFTDQLPRKPYVMRSARRIVYITHHVTFGTSDVSFELHGLCPTYRFPGKRDEVKSVRGVLKIKTSEKKIYTVSQKNKDFRKKLYRVSQQNNKEGYKKG